MEDSRALEEAKRLFEEYRKTKDVSKLDKAISLLEGKESIHCLNQLGLLYLEKGEYKKAVECFEKALKKTKKEDEKNVINFNLALAHFRLKDLNRAYEILRDLSNDKNLGTHAKRLLAKVCLSFGDLKHVEEARSILEGFDMPTEDLIVAYIYLARNGRKEYLDKAVKYAELLKNKKLLAEALLSYDEKEKIEKALELFREINDVKGEARALYRLSFYNPDLLYEALQKLEEAGEGTLQDRIRLLNELYKRTGILDFLKQAIKLAEEAKEYLFLARAYVELSKKENELENLRKAVKYYEEFIKEKLY